MRRANVLYPSAAVDNESTAAHTQNRIDRRLGLSMAGSMGLSNKTVGLEGGHATKCTNSTLGLT
jgi:hypothetical protein